MSPPRWSGRVRGCPPPSRPTRMRSITGMRCGASPHWPGVISRASGRRPPSPATWILQVRPPRERPSPSSGRCCWGARLFPALVAVSYEPRRRADEPGRRSSPHSPSTSRSGLPHRRRPGRPRRAVPCAVRRPASMPLIHGLPFAETCRQIPPRHPGPIPVQDPVDDSAVAAPTPTALPGLRQIQLQPGPLFTREISPPHEHANEPRLRRSHDPPDRADSAWWPAARRPGRRAGEEPHRLNPRPARPSVALVGRGMIDRGMTIV